MSARFNLIGSPVFGNGLRMEGFVIEAPTMGSLSCFLMVTQCRGTSRVVLRFLTGLLVTSKDVSPLL